MKGRERAASSDVRLDEEVRRTDELPADEAFYENKGSFFWGEADGHDIMVLEGFFGFQRGKNGVYPIIGGDRSTTLYATYAVVPQDEKGGMVDNDFYGNWIDCTNEPVPNLEVIRESDRVIWKGGNRQYINRPPYWDIKGENLGVDFDVTLGGLGPVHRPSSFDNLKEARHASVWNPCWAEGTITFNGKTYTLENGYGMHTYMIHGGDWDAFDFVRQAPYYWIWGMTESFQFYTFKSFAPHLGYNDCYVWDDGQQITFPGEQVVLDELETWNDPRSGMNWPCRWHINMNSEGGILDINVAGRCRGIFGTKTRSGLKVQYGVLARGNGRFFRPNGRSIALQNIQVYVERGRAFMPFDKAV